MTDDEEALIACLERWSMETGGFHEDRQLADEVLVADGWHCEPDASFEGGVRWFWGTNPQYSASESSRPHPVNDLNAAVGVVPFKYNWRLEVHGDRATASVWEAVGHAPQIHQGKSERPAVALVIAALRAKAWVG